MPPTRRLREALLEPLHASVQEDLAQITSDGHAFPVAEQQQVAVAPSVGGGVLLCQLQEAGRDLADRRVGGRARQDAAFSLGLARQQQQQEHADRLGLARAGRAPDEAELRRAVAARRRDAAQNGVGLRVVELERGQFGRHVGAGQICACR